MKKIIILLISTIFLICACDTFQKKETLKQTQKTVSFDTDALEEIETLVNNFSQSEESVFLEDGEKRKSGTITFYLNRRDTTKEIGENIEILLTMMFSKNGVSYKVKITSKRAMKHDKLKEKKIIRFKTNNKEKLLSQLKISLASLGD